MKKVLIITYYWPPCGGSGVQRWVKFCKYLPLFGWQPVIYTPANPEMTAIDRSLEEDIPSEAIVVKRHITEFYSLYRMLTGNKNASQQEVNPINSGKKSFLQKLFMMIRGNLFIPDPRITWVRPSVKFLSKYLEEHPVDAIVSTGPPHSMHLIAMALAAKTGLPWVADFRDPWTKLFYFKHLMLSPWAKHRHRILEKKVLDSASVVVAVSPLVRDDFMKMTQTPVVLITNGYDEDDFAQEADDDGYFNVTHTGLLASDGNPEVIWKALADKCSQDPEFRQMLHIRLSGKTDADVIASIKAAGLGDNLVNLGYKEHLVAIREQKNASLLILPLRKEPEYKATLPGKLFEYLASMNPILGIGQTDGAMASIVNSTGAGVVFGWHDLTSVSAFIDLCWKSYKSQSQAQTEDVNTDVDDIFMTEDKKEKIRQYSRKALTSRMADLLDDLTGMKKPQPKETGKSYL